MRRALSRRGFLKMSGALAVGAAASPQCAHAQARQIRDPGKTVLPYPRTSIVKVNQLQENVPVSFHFPDAASPCVLIKARAPVVGGIGPEQNIVAFSTTCTHMGCPVEYRPQSGSFRCPCHYTTFDAHKEGQMICGQATENLPQIVLEYDASTDSVFAVAVRGLLYGRQSNIL